jgi:hypothetical protein
MFPDSEAAGGPGAQSSRDAGAFVSLMRGIHW